MKKEEEMEEEMEEMEEREKKRTLHIEGGWRRRKEEEGFWV